MNIIKLQWVAVLATANKGQHAGSAYTCIYSFTRWIPTKDNVCHNNLISSITVPYTFLLSLISCRGA